MGARAGGLSKQYAEELGLNEGIAVSIPGIDAHVGAIGGGVKEGMLVSNLGTSWCHMAVDKFHEVPGLFGIIDNGILPGYFGFEAGQASGGSVLDWFVKECVGTNYTAAAGEDVQQYLTELVHQYKIGQTGLVALDWLTGNRSILNDAKLSGLMLGVTTDTTAPQMYHSWLSSLAMGMEVITHQMEQNGVIIEGITACASGSKNELLLDMIANTTGKPVYVSEADETVAVGAAMLAAVAAGRYKSIQDAQIAMGGLKDVSYRPAEADTATHRAWSGLKDVYRSLHDQFGRKGDPNYNDAMHQLRALKESV